MFTNLANAPHFWKTNANTSVEPSELLARTILVACLPPQLGQACITKFHTAHRNSLGQHRMLVGDV